MSTTTNVAFYEKLKYLQENQHENERKRMDLEQQLNTYIKSDNRLARLKALRLQNYWKKICDDEKRSQSRNEQLLRDLERVDSHMNTLSMRTEKLRNMKNQYEKYIENTYPNWKEKILHQQRLQEHHKRQQQMQSELEALTPAAMTSSPGYVSLPNHDAYRISTTLPALNPDADRAAAPGDYISAGVVPPFPGHASLPHQQPAPEQYHGHGLTEGETQMFAAALYQGDPVSNRTPRYLQELGQSARKGSEGLIEPMVSSRDGPKPVVSARGQPKEQVKSVDPSAVANLADSINRGHGEIVIPAAVEDEDDSIKEEAIEAVSSPRRPVSWKTPVAGTAEPKNTKVPTAQSKVYQGADDTDDFDTDMSLPMSGADAKPIAVVPSSGPSNEQPVTPRVQSPQAVYKTADITIDGLYNLLLAVEDELPTTRQGDDLYRMETQLAESVEQEIYRNANKSAVISHINATSISMVILNQLQLLVLGSENSCLLADHILADPPPQATQDNIRSTIHLTCQAFWDRLCLHFLHLLKYEVMTAQEVGEIFGPLLITEYSHYEHEAKAVLTSVMLNSDPGLIKSPVSTSTFSTLPSPRKRVDDMDGKGQNIISATITVPPKSDNNVPPEIIEEEVDDDEEDEEDDFFDQPVPKQEPPAPVSTTLTQSAAYQQFLGDTRSTSQHSASFEDSEDDDDIEQQLGSMALGKPSRQNSQKLSKPQESVSEKDRPLTPSGGSRVDSPSLGSAGGGYIPSGLDTAGKSPGSLGSSGKQVKKGPAFSFGGDSDTDEDIDIPGMGAPDKPGTIKHGQEEDDFDFYG